MYFFWEILKKFQEGTIRKARRTSWDTWIERRRQYDGYILTINQGPHIFPYWTPNHLDMFEGDWIIIE